MPWPRGGFPGRFAHGRHPAHLRLAGPQLMTEWVGFRLVSNREAAQRGHQVLLRAAPACVAAGHDVGLDVDHQLGYLPAAPRRS
jgi:hypothetical protein